MDAAVTSVAMAALVADGLLAGLSLDGASKAFARLLVCARKPFDLINYLGSCVGARIIPPRRMLGMLGRVTAALQRHLEREPDSALRRGMHYPATWDRSSPAT